MSSSRAITLDPSRQKLLIPPNEPLPKFYPKPRALMVTPIYDTRELSQGTFPQRDMSAWDPRGPEAEYSSSVRSGARGVYSDSEWEDARRRDMHGYRDSSRSRTPRQRDDHRWSRHRRSSGEKDRSNSDSEASYEGHRRRAASHARSAHGTHPRSSSHPHSSSRRHDVDDDEDEDADEEYSPGGLSRAEYASRSRVNGQFSVPGHTAPSGHGNQRHADDDEDEDVDEEYSPERLTREEYASRSRVNGQFSVPGHTAPSGHGNQGHAPSQLGHAPSQGYVPSQLGRGSQGYASSQGHAPSHGYIPSQHDYGGHVPSHASHASSPRNFNGYTPSHPPSSNSYQPAPSTQQLMTALSSQGTHNKLRKPSFLGGLAQSALGRAPSSSQGQYSPYSQNAPLAHSQSQQGQDPLAGMHLPPATTALLRYAQDKGILDQLAKYFQVLPPHPNFCYSKCTGRKKAVCIGINYVGQRDELKGCANDARNMRDFLIRNYGFKSQDILLVLDGDTTYGHGQPRPTRKEMFNAMAWLVRDAHPQDSLFFHYSGHGGQSPDASGMELDGMDEVIFPVDYDDRHGHEGPFDIIDDELHEALVHGLPVGVRLTAVFDSCHSGTVLDLPYLHSAHGRLRSMNHISKRAQKRGAADPADVICFAACKDDETSADTREGSTAVGAMSWAFIQALDRNRNQTYEELLQHLRATLIPKYHQKAQVSGTHPVDLTRQFIL